MRVAILLVAALSVLAGMQAKTATGYFDVTFGDCTEFVGIGSVGLPEAQALVPPGFSVLDVGNMALLVVRISSCGSVGVDGDSAQPGTVAHIGINIVPPDGLGDINNYTLTFVSDLKVLVKKLRASGLSARLDSDLLYEFTSGSGTSGNLLGAVSPSGGIRWHVYGRESDPAPDSAFPFRAIWWASSQGRIVRMDTTFPTIAFGDAEVSLHTPKESFLADLIGGSTVAAFSGLSVRGVFDHARMTVTTSP